MENIGEKYAREYKAHLIEKYHLPKDATWQQIEEALYRARGMKR